jgi:hypothetical protein
MQFGALLAVVRVIRGNLGCVLLKIDEEVEFSFDL